jgi:uncharacterized FlaG/YvyC family protein
MRVEKNGPVARSTIVPEPNVARESAQPDPIRARREAEPGALAEVREHGEEAEAPERHTREEIDRVIEMANDLARRLDVKILFRRSDADEDYHLEVVDRETGELIRRVPPEEMIAHIENFSGFEGLLTEPGA